MRRASLSSDSGQSAVAQWNQTATDAGTLIFSAPYTDTFFTSSSRTPISPRRASCVTVYIATNYESNVVIG